MSRIGIWTVVSAVLISACIGTAFGAPTIGVSETWDTGNLNGWLYETGTPPGGGATNVDVGAIGGHPNAVRVMFADQGGIPSPEDEKIYAIDTSSGGAFAGNANYTIGMMGIRFNFYADDYTTASDTLSLFFYSSTSNRVWQYSLSGPATVGTWVTYNVPMYWTGTGWSSPGAGQTDFNFDLQDVDQIGVWVRRSADTGAQEYGIDDFTLPIPEPGTYAMLAVTLSSLYATLRRRRDCLPGSLRDLLKGS
jgi:hypothetical protein